MENTMVGGVVLWIAPSLKNGMTKRASTELENEKGLINNPADILAKEGFAKNTIPFSSAG